MDGRPSLSERFERHALGQVVIGALVVLVILAEIGIHLPPSAIEREVSPTANRVIRLLAAEQAWGVFAPDPRGTSLKLEGRVTFADGSTEVWHLPEGAIVGENLRYYRWRKWLERVRSDQYTDIWDPTARWIASLYDDRDSAVVRVELVRLFHENSIQGPQPPWEEFTYYTLELDPGER
ncbi:MAG TPA: hypothetical protein VJ804_04865 [Acidimicrobiales bacterium]|nr:hypothetical protein [Acidimicrobiales bacterium]